ncbi:MAG: hypothetical protein INR71_04290, partial [Terriglobus roseus]|nr:hypothetical protein [Terriglobus roseus]
MSQDDGADAATTASASAKPQRASMSLPSFVSGTALTCYPLSLTTFLHQVHSIVQDSLMNILHDVILETHRNEKLLRMQSAATQVSILAANQQLQSPHPANDTPTKSSGSFSSSQSKGKVETDGATWSDGVITLKGNPLETTKQIYCPQCRLPRLLYPLFGVGARVPDDVNTDYCKKHPYVTRQGLDVYGQPFPTDASGKSKKEKELLKQQQRADKDSTPASQNSGADGRDDEQQAANGIVSKLAPQGKGANYIPWQTCPKCKRSLLITRFAQHLEKCMGISGRLASRNAMAKMSGPNGSIGSTPMG